MSVADKSQPQPTGPLRPSHPAWMGWWLIAAGVYNLLWGGVVVLFPNLLFDLTGMPPPLYPQIWQVVGMIVGVYGVGYLVAARDPIRHWPIVLVGLLGKVLGPVGYAGGLAASALGMEDLVARGGGTLPAEFGYTIITNDLVWWPAFALILLAAWKQRRSAQRA